MGRRTPKPRRCGRNPGEQAGRTPARGRRLGPARESRLGATQPGLRARGKRGRRRGEGAPPSVAVPPLGTAPPPGVQTLERGRRYSGGWRAREPGGGVEGAGERGTRTGRGSSRPAPLPGAATPSAVMSRKPDARLLSAKMSSRD